MAAVKVKGPNGLVIPMPQSVADALVRSGKEFEVVKDEPKAKPAAKSEATKSAK